MGGTTLCLTETLDASDARALVTGLHELAIEAAMTLVSILGE